MIKLNHHKVLDAIRIVLEEHYATLPTGRQDLTGMCAIAAKLVSEYGIGRFVYGQVWSDKRHYTEHCWNVVGDYLVDVTASQFGGPRLVIHPIDRPVPYPVRYIECGQPNFIEWPNWQRPNRILLDELKRKIDALIL